MNITFVYSNANCSCTRKCTFELSSELKKSNNVRNIYFKDLTEGIYSSSDVVILQRLGANGTPIGNKFINDIAQWRWNENVKLFYMLDDLIFTKESEVLINYCHATITFADVYRRYIPSYTPMYQMRTFIDAKQFLFINRIKVPDNKFNVLWASTGGLGTKIVNTIEPELKKSGVNIISLNRTPYQEYLRYVKSVDVVIAPAEVGDHSLATKEFLDAKSCIKYVEAGILGIPVVASPTAPYKEAIIDFDNGFIAETPSKFIYYILRLQNERKLREEIAKRCQSDILKNYTANVAAERFMKIVKEHKTTIK